MKTEGKCQIECLEALSSDRLATLILAAVLTIDYALYEGRGSGGIVGAVSALFYRLNLSASATADWE